MANKFIYQHRRGTTERWQTSDVVLRNGEIAIEDCGEGHRGILIGNGTDTYANLPKIYLHEVMTKTTIISLLAADWVGEVSPYYQQVSISNTTEHSKIDLQPTPELLTYLQDEEITLTTSNDAGIIKVYALNNKPTQDMEIQATISEVKANS